MGGSLLPQSLPCSTQEVWEKWWGKKLSTLFVVPSLPVMLISSSIFWHSFLADIPVEGWVFFASLAKISSSNTLAFLTLSLHIQAVSQYSSQDTSPYFHWLCIPSCTFTLITRSWLIHGGLLPSFPDFSPVRIENSCALWKVSLKICQFCSAPLSLRAVSRGSYWIELRKQNLGILPS